MGDIMHHGNMIVGPKSGRILVCDKLDWFDPHSSRGRWAIAAFRQLLDAFG